MRNILLFVLLTTTSVASAATVGVSSKSFVDGARARTLNAYIWYPSSSNQPRELGRTTVYQGFPAALNADLSAERAPLIVLVHGSHGNRTSLSWLAVALAERGFIVVAASHPGSTTGDATPESLIRMWNQPADVKFLIDQMFASEYGKHIDKDNITVIGTSLGGYTALSLVGVELQFQQFLKFCAAHDEGACRDFKSAMAIVNEAFYENANANHLDARVTAAVSIVPGFTESMTEASIQKLAVPVLVVGAEQDGQVPVATHARPLARLLPRGSVYHEVSEATHFSFLPQCTPGALAILAEEREEFVCQDGATKTRAQIHAETIDVIEKFLARQKALLR